MSTLETGTYEAAGVSLDAMDGIKDRIKAFAALTHGPEVLDSSGGFAGLFALGRYSDPVLVASADGVGTKLKIAAQLGHFEGVGQDLVTLNVNDILTKGARPLFFLDYVSFTAFDEHRLEMLMRGIVWGCREAGCALIGGETAQLPGVYGSNDFDLAGFVVGVAEREALLDQHAVRAGDRLIGIPSSGVHTNGFSLVRRVFGLDENPTALFQPWPGLERNLGDELMVRHRGYYPMLAEHLGSVKALSHITGGGVAGQDAGVAAARRGRGVPPGFLDGSAHIRRDPEGRQRQRRRDVPGVQHGFGHGGRVRRRGGRVCDGRSGRRR